MQEPYSAPCYTGTSMCNTTAASAYADAVRSMHPPSYGQKPFSSVPSVNGYTRTASNMMMNARPRSVMMYPPPNAAITRTASNRGLMTPPSYMSTGRNMGMSLVHIVMTSRTASRNPMSAPPPHMKSMQPKPSGFNFMMWTGSHMMYPNVRAAAQFPRPMYTHN